MDDRGRIKASLMENKVYVVWCPDYDQVQVRIADLFDLMGGWGGSSHQASGSCSRPIFFDRRNWTKRQPHILRWWLQWANWLCKKGLFLSSSKALALDTSTKRGRFPGFELFSTLASGAGWGDTMVWWQRALMPLLRDGLSLRLGVVEDRCIACGACREACPVKAISQTDGRPPRIDEGECIRCYCCHEMCPEHVIELRPSLLYRLINWRKPMEVDYVTPT
jgi:ferredoxin